MTIDRALRSLAFDTRRSELLSIALADPHANPPRSHAVVVVDRATGALAPRPLAYSVGAIAYDAGMQIGATEAQGVTGRKQALTSLTRLEGRLRKEAALMVEELLAGWREFAAR